MKNRNFTIAAAAAIIGMALICTACQFDGQKIVDQFLLGSYGTYKWDGDKLTISSTESNFKKVYKVDGSGHFMPDPNNFFEIYIPKGTALKPNL